MCNVTFFFTQVTRCNQSQEIIWGVGPQGYKCSGVCVYLQTEPRRNKQQQQTLNPSRGPHKDNFAMSASKAGFTSTANSHKKTPQLTFSLYLETIFPDCGFDVYKRYVYRVEEPCLGPLLPTATSSDANANASFEQVIITFFCSKLGVLWHFFNPRAAASAKVEGAEEATAPARAAT